MMDESRAKELLEQLLREKVGETPSVKVLELKDKILAEKGRLSPKTLHQYEWSFRKLAEYTDYWPTDAAVINGFIGSLKGLGDESVLWRSSSVCGRWVGIQERLMDGVTLRRRPSVRLSSTSGDGI